MLLSIALKEMIDTCLHMLFSVYQGDIDRQCWLATTLSMAQVHNISLRMLHLTKQNRLQRLFVARLQKFLRETRIGVAFFGAVAKSKAGALFSMGAPVFEKPQRVFCEEISPEGRPGC